MSTTDETLVREVLRRATDDLTAPAHRLTEQASTRGRRLRRRRRVLGTAGALCSAALLAGLVAVVAGGQPHASAPIATDPAPGPSEATQEPQPTPDPQPADAGTWTQMPATQMLTVLKSLTPDDLSFADPVTTNEDRAPGEPEGVMQGWLLADVVSDGATSGGINVILMGPGEPSSRYTCPGNLEAPDACTEITDAGGATIGRRSTATRGGVTVHEVVLVGPGGGLVYVAASNSADDKWGAGSSIASDTVPLTLGQLTAIASDSAWTTWEPAARARS
jgi:hypothetical protein